MRMAGARWLGAHAQLMVWREWNWQWTIHGCLDQNSKALATMKTCCIQRGMNAMVSIVRIRVLGYGWIRVAAHRRCLEFSGYCSDSGSSGGMEHHEHWCPCSDWRTGMVGYGFEFDFKCFLCFKQHQKQKHAWKQKGRLERRKSRLGHYRLMRQMQVLVWISLMGNCWAMDVNVAQQIAELAEAATRAAQAATTVAERVGSKGGMAMEKMLLHLWVGNWTLRHGCHMVMNVLVSCWAKSRGCPMLLFILHMILKRSLCPISSLQSWAAIWEDVQVLWCVQLQMVTKMVFDLCREYLPTSKQRTLSLARTLAQYPQFSSK